MKYKIFDKVNNEYLDLTKYCVNGYGDVMTTKGLVLMNQEDFRVEIEPEIIFNNVKSLTEQDFENFYDENSKTFTIKGNDEIEELDKKHQEWFKNDAVKIEKVKINQESINKIASEINKEL